MGVEVPCLAIGRIALTLPLILAVLMAVSLTERAKHWQWMVLQVKKPSGIMLIPVVLASGQRAGGGAVLTNDPKLAKADRNAA